MQVGNLLELIMLHRSRVMLHAHDTLLEQMLEDCLLRLLWDENHCAKINLMSAAARRLEPNIVLSYIDNMYLH